jgi:MYXO-CTERM domain-containing protein
LFDLDGNGGDGNGSDLEDASGVWMFLEFDVSGLGAGHLHLSVANNSGSEIIFIDAVTITGGVIPAPGALALLGLAGIASRRRRR